MLLQIQNQDSAIIILSLLHLALPDSLKSVYSWCWSKFVQTLSVQINQQNVDTHYHTGCTSIYLLYWLLTTCTFHIYIYQHLLITSAFVVIGRKCNEVCTLANEWHCTSCHVMSYVVGWCGVLPQHLGYMALSLVYHALLVYDYHVQARAIPNNYQIYLLYSSYQNIPINAFTLTCPWQDHRQYIYEQLLGKDYIELCMGLNSRFCITT